MIIGNIKVNLLNGAIAQICPFRIVLVCSGSVLWTPKTGLAGFFLSMFQGRLRFAAISYTLSHAQST